MSSTLRCASAAYRRIADETALTPVLCWFELRNVLLMGERRKRITEIQTVRFLRRVGELPIEVDRDPDENAVLRLARIYRLSVNDAVYLELAQRTGLPLSTLDGALLPRRSPKESRSSLHERAADPPIALPLFDTHSALPLT